jgi:hypothetical protein
MYTKFEKDILAKENKLLSLISYEDALKKAQIDKELQLERLRKQVKEEGEYFESKYAALTDSMHFENFKDEIVQSIT